MASGGVQLVPKAVIGVFVCNEETIYAVVCKHITDNANRHLYVPDLQSHFARRISKSRRGESPTYTQFDIDLIKVEKKHIQKCNPVFRDAQGNPKKGRVFEGDVNDFKDREVFTYRNGTVGTGKVLDSSQIEKCLKTYSMDTHFFVGGDSFADAGDSGRVVAFDDGNAFLELVGIVVHKTGDQTVCLKLHKGLEYLNNEYRLKLSLWEPEQESNVTSSENRLIEPGMLLRLVADKSK